MMKRYLTVVLPLLLARCSTATVSSLQEQVERKLSDSTEPLPDIEHVRADEFPRIIAGEEVLIMRSQPGQDREAVVGKMRGISIRPAEDEAGQIRHTYMEQRIRHNSRISPFNDAVPSDSLITFYGDRSISVMVGTTEYTIPYYQIDAVYRVDSYNTENVEPTTNAGTVFAVLAILLAVTLVYLSISCVESANTASGNATALTSACSSTATQCSGYRQPSCNFDGP